MAFPKITLLFLTSTLIITSGCQSLRKYSDESISDGNTCADSYYKIMLKSDAGALNLIRKMFYQRCYEETIQATEYARNAFRDSTISVVRDVAEVIAFEGTLIDYVMESYERTYLSILAVRSYMELGRNEEAKAALRKAYEESVAVIDTRGQDRVTLFMMAVLWTKLGEPQYSDPMYRKIIELNPSAHDFYAVFAKEQLERPNHNKVKNLVIFELGSMPDLELGFGGQLYFQYPAFEFASGVGGEKLYDYDINKIKGCEKSNIAVASTEDWLQFLRDRSSYSNSPKGTIKKIARLPMTLLVSSSILVGGTYLTLAIAANSNGSGTSDLVQGLGGATFKSAAYIFNSGLAPDQRYWSNMPQALMVSDRDVSPWESGCLKESHKSAWLNPQRFL